MASWKKIHQQVISLPFEFDADRDRIKGFLHMMGGFIKTEKELTELSRLISRKEKELTGFDSGIFFDPRKLIVAIMSSDILGHYINHEEANVLYQSLENYLLHKEEVLQDKEYVEKHYNVQIKAIMEKTKRQSITAHPLAEIQFINCIPEIKKLISLYPPVFIKNIKLKSVVLASSFTQNTKGNLCIYLGGFATNEDYNIYLTANQCHKSFHHELYHQAMQHYNDVREWSNLRTEKGHFYNSHDIDRKTTGFAVNYGRENVAEDQATIAEYMIKDHASMLRRAKHDPLLRHKMQLVYKAMFELSDGLITEHRFSQL